MIESMVDSEESRQKDIYVLCGYQGESWDPTDSRITIRKALKGGLNKKQMSGVGHDIAIGAPGGDVTKTNF